MADAQSDDRGPSSPAQPQKTADRPHRISITLGLLSPLLAVVSLIVSFFTFHNAQQSMKVAQQAYLGFHFETARLALSQERQGRFVVEARATVKNLGHTPAYFDKVTKRLYLAEGDNLRDSIDPSIESSPDLEAIGPSDDPIELRFTASFPEKDFVGDRSIVYRIDVQWRNAFEDSQPISTFCVMMPIDLPITATRELNAAPCPRGFTVTQGSQ